MPVDLSIRRCFLSGLCAAKFDRTAARALCSLDHGSFAARHTLHAARGGFSVPIASNHHGRQHVCSAKDDADNRNGSDPGENDADHDAGDDAFYFLHIPFRTRPLLDREQSARYRSAILDPE